jgi:hypothetical protein
MNESRFTKFNSSARHLGMVILGVLAAAGAYAVGCLPPDAGGGSEGDRCNPSLSHDECGSGLVCTQPTDCPENYCCPTSGSSSNPYCQTGCAGGAFSAAVAGFYQTCASSMPDPLCSCFSPPIFAAGTSWDLQVDAGPLCYCFAQQDPVACLAAAAADAGGDGAAPGEGGTADTGADVAAEGGDSGSGDAGIDSGSPGADSSAEAGGDGSIADAVGN